MIFNMHTVLAAVLTVASCAAADADSSAGVSRELLRGVKPQDDIPCGKLKGCYLYNKSTKSEVMLTGDDEYCPTDSVKGWSVRCDTNLPVSLDCDDNEVTAVIDQITYTYDEVVTVEVDEPRWMGGDTEATTKCEARKITSVEYLHTRGEKVFKIAGKKGIDICFVRAYILRDMCSGAPPQNTPVIPRSVEVPAPTKTPTKAPTKSPTKSPTKAPTKSPTNAPTDAPERPPQSTNCYMWTDKRIFFGYNADIPAGTIVEVKTESGAMYSYPSVAGKPIVWATESHVNVFNKKDFELRFVLPDSGASGDWQSCINYFGTTKSPTQPEKCFMWSNRLYYGSELGRVTSGYKIEVRTVANKYFEYISTGGRWVKANDFRDYDSEKFDLRIVDNDGQSGPWKQCVNYTPIALDIDRSGAVEHTTGEFVIDITGDGTAETLEEWFAPTEGILIDTKHGVDSGIITGHHLFGDMGRTYVDGYEKLATLDANNDDAVSGDELDGLAIWIDANSNAVLDDGEMTSLESHNIVSLSTLHEDFLSKATLGDGSTMVMEDKWFIR